MDQPGEQRPASPPGFGKRHLLCLLAFFGFANLYSMRVNLSIALVAMVNHTYDLSNGTTNEPECKPDNGNTTMKDGEFSWNHITQGTILGAFFYGYLITQLPGGYLAERYGGKHLLGYGVLLTALFTLLTPLAAEWGFVALVACRVIEGFGEGVCYPAMHSMYAKWAPPLERSKLVAITFAGTHFGTILTLPLAGLLLFYIFGGLACVWFVFWTACVSSSPDVHPTISANERVFIRKSIGEASLVRAPITARKVFEIATSPAVWAIIVVNFACNWQLYTLLTCLPIYLKEVLGFDIQHNGLISAIPYVVLFCVMSSSGVIADLLRKRRVFSTTVTRKLFNLCGLALPSVLLIVTGYVGCNRFLQVLLLSASTGFQGMAQGAGYNMNHLDIAPQFAGTLMGISNTIATIAGFVGPAVVGALTNGPGNQTRARWQIVFYISLAIAMFGCVFNLIFTSGKQQRWSLAVGEEDEEKLIQDSQKREHEGYGTGELEKQA